MFKSIYEDIKAQFIYGNNITRIIVVNVVIFILLYIVYAGIALTVGPDYVNVQKSVLHWFTLPASPIEILKKPWTILTHMFLHERPMHLVWNMLTIYWFGRIFGDLMGDQRVVPLYIYSGLMGILFIQIGFLIGIPSGPALGASAAALGLVVGSAIVAPDYDFNLPFIGPVKLKYIALFFIVVDLVGIANLNNTGGHFAHIGGMVMGWLFITMINSGNDPSPWFNRTMNRIGSIFSPSKKVKKSPLKVRHKAPITKGNTSNRKSASGKQAPPDSNQYQLDIILDKISKQGIESLSKKEKDFLDNASKND